MADAHENSAPYYDLATSAQDAPDVSPFVRTNASEEARLSGYTLEGEKKRIDSQDTLNKDVPDEYPSEKSAEAGKFDEANEGEGEDEDVDVEKQKSHNEKDVEDEENDKNIVDWDGDDDPVSATPLKIAGFPSDGLRKIPTISHSGGNGKIFSLVYPTCGRVH